MTTPEHRKQRALEAFERILAQIPGSHYPQEMVPDIETVHDALQDAQPEARGQFNCDICGSDKPHHHYPDDGHYDEGYDFEQAGKFVADHIDTIRAALAPAWQDITQEEFNTLWEKAFNDSRGANVFNDKPSFKKCLTDALVEYLASISAKSWTAESDK